MTHYKTKGTCSTAIDMEVENGVITYCKFTGGCRGNTQGIERLVVGQKAEDMIRQLRGIGCQGNTSCPDQLSYAPEKALAQPQ